MCSATENGTPAQATVRVLDADGAELAQGRTGERLAVPPGDHRVEIRLDGTLDHTRVEKPVQVRVGRRVAVNAAFRTGTLLVEVRDGEGRPSAAQLTIHRADGERIGSTAAGVGVRLGVGTYEVRVRRLRQERRVREVEIAPGETRRVVVTLDS